jgi:hypothetical protein
VALVLDGHDAAFELLFDRHVAEAVWFAREVLGSWGEAEEAVRHSFAAAHAYLGARGREIEFAPWLHTIVSNHCLSMLQARTPGPAGPAHTAAVVDLDEWRRKRKLLGAALPVAPTVALRDGVMAACGIGGGAATGGAATAGAPLLGGTVAKLAVVAVLAGSAGVVGGNAAPDRAEPVAAGGAQAVVEGVAAKAPPTGRYLAREPSDRVGGLRRPAVRKRDDAAPRETIRRRPGPRAQGPADQPPNGSPAPTAGRQPSSAAPDPAPAAPAAPTAKAPHAAIPSSARSAPQRVGDAVEAHLPAVSELPHVQPVAAGLAKIGDDLGVTAVKPPVDVRPLLSRVTSAPRR